MSAVIAPRVTLYSFLEANECNMYPIFLQENRKFGIYNIPNLCAYISVLQGDMLGELNLVLMIILTQMYMEQYICNY